VKALYPDAMTVFIGPCLAKKAEARRKDLAGAVDYVLTFEETRPSSISWASIRPRWREREGPLHPDGTGIRAHGRGERGGPGNRSSHQPQPPIEVRTRQEDGVPACRAMMNDIRAGKGGETSTRAWVAWAAAWADPGRDTQGGGPGGRKRLRREGAVPHSRRKTLTSLSFGEAGL
jgi:hypothetical protein